MLVGVVIFSGVGKMVGFKTKEPLAIPMEIEARITCHGGCTWHDIVLTKEGSSSIEKYIQEPMGLEWTT